MRFGATAYVSEEELEELSETEEPSADGKKQKLLYDEKQKEHRDALLDALDGEDDEEEGESFGGLERAQQESRQLLLPDPEAERRREDAQKVVSLVQL